MSAENDPVGQSYLALLDLISYLTGLLLKTLFKLEVLSSITRCERVDQDVKYTVGS